MNKVIVTSLMVLFSIAAPLVFAQDSVEVQQKKLQDVVDHVTWKNLNIDFFDVKDKAQNGYKAMTVKSIDNKNGLTFYVAPKPVLNLQDTRSMDVSYNPGDGDNLRLMVRFNPDGKKSLFDYSSAHINEMMGIVVDGKLRLVANLRRPLTNGRIQVYGFSANEAIGILQRYYQPKIEAARKFNEQLSSTKLPQK